MNDATRDPAYDSARDALSDPAYEAAFLKLAQGQDALLTEQERTAAERAKRATASWGTPGWPVPASIDPTRVTHEGPTDAQLIAAAKRLLDQLEARFGPMPPELRAQIEARWEQGSRGAAQ